MNHKAVIFAGALFLFSSLSVAVFAQSSKGSLGRLLPLLVDVEQMVPIEAVIESLDGITVTVPLTMTVNLQVRLDGLQLASAQVLTDTKPTIVIRRPISDERTDSEESIDNVAWAVESVDRLGKQMKLRNQEGLNFETRGEFLILNIVLENMSNEPTAVGEYDDYSNVSIELIDERGRIFAPFEVGYLLEELCSSVELNPGIPTPCIIPFEIATNVSELYLRLSDVDSEDVIEIVIPE